MVSPAQRRRGVAWAREAYRIPERRACRVIGISRSTVRYRSVRPPYTPLRARLRELAAVRVSAGYRFLHTLLQREGWRVNHKLVERLYREEGLTLRRRKTRRRKSAVKRQVPNMPGRPNERWAMDFMHDTLADGRTIRVLTVLDVYSRECVGLVAGGGFKGEDVGMILSQAGKKRGALPGIISVDNGTEFTSKALDHWAYWNKVRLNFSRPGRPGDNPHIEAFNSLVRRECLSQHWFIDLKEAQDELDRWRLDYNTVRPHGSLRRSTPAQVGAGAYLTPSPERLQNLRP
jgi:putative transposase